MVKSTIPEDSCSIFSASTQLQFQGMRLLLISVGTAQVWHIDVHTGKMLIYLNKIK